MKCYHLFYQISEFSLVEKFWKWGIKTGRVLNTKTEEISTRNNIATTKQEFSAMKFVRGRRSWVSSLFREIIWLLGGWKTKKLKGFIADFDPDIVWLDGSPLILMNRLNNYVYKIVKKLMVAFLMDDVYCYESCLNAVSRVFKYFLRRQVKQTVEHSRHILVSSLKMKEEYDRIFGVENTFITKSFDANTLKTNVDKIHKPVRMVYLDNVLIGRLESLIRTAACTKEINRNGQKLRLSIYTGDIIPKERMKHLLVDSSAKICSPMAYDKVPEIIAENDVRVSVESMEGKNTVIARLSLPTKIIDYIQSGKCILAVGPKDMAPIRYFRNEDAALVASTKEGLMQVFLRFTDESVIRRYAEKTVACGKRNHDRGMMHTQTYSITQGVSRR